jgi:hypothetical protein
LKIVNVTDHAVAFQRVIEIEMKSAKGWGVAAIQAVADCSEFYSRS